MKRFRKPAIIFIFLLFLMASMACGTTEKYLIGTDATCAPFVFRQQGQLTGIDMELIAEIAKDQHFDYEVVVLGLDAALQALEANQVDGVMAGIDITKELAPQVDFSQPYFDSGVVLAVSEDNTRVTGYEDLAGKTVAVREGSDGAVVAESIKDRYRFTTITLKSPEDLFREVLTGSWAACFEDYPTVAHAIFKGTAVRMVTPIEHRRSMGLVVRKDGNDALLEKFNTGLDNLKKNGIYQQILAKYI